MKLIKKYFFMFIIFIITSSVIYAQGNVPIEKDDVFNFFTFRSHPFIGKLNQILINENDLSLREEKICNLKELESFHKFSTDIISKYTKDIKKISKDFYLLYLILDNIYNDFPCLSNRLNIHSDYYFQSFTKLLDKLGEETRLEFLMKAGSDLVYEGRTRKATYCLNRLKMELPDKNPLTIKLLDRLITYSSICVGSKIPNVSFWTTDNKKVELSDFNSKYLLLIFWKMNCSSSHREVMNVNEIYKNYNKNDFEALGITWPWLSKVNQQEVHDFISKNDIEFPNVIIGKEIQDIFGLTDRTTTILISPTGEVISKNIRRKKLSEHIRQIINK